MKIAFKPYTLEFKTPFKISHSVRTTTPVVFVRIECEGVFGYGEASMPPYLEETQSSVCNFLSKAKSLLTNFKSPENIENILKEIDGIEPGNTAAKASLDIALHDLKGKFLNQPCYKFWNLDKKNIPFTTYTIGISDLNSIEQKIKDASDYKILKVKLGSNNDKKIIEEIRRLTDKPLVVDVNQGWDDKYFTLDMIHWLAEKNVLLVEQPMKKKMIDEMAWVTEQSPLPTIADESCQRFSDIERLQYVFSGINVKLMKCTGMSEAHKMILSAKKNGMRILLGCMSETSCAVSAAAQLSPLADWADLDGPLLIKKDYFEGINFSEGKIILSDASGIGVTPTEKLFD